MTEELIPQQDTGLVLDALRRFTGEFKHIRHQIENMDDDELIALYQQAKEISDASWLIRVIVIGTAKQRAVKGDGTVKSIAGAFGIGVRMAEMDIQIYEAFIKDNPDFEPELPASFYHKAILAPDPTKAIDYAMERRLENPAYPASDFQRYVKGEMPREKTPPGYYMLMPIAKADMEVLKEEKEETVLFGKLALFSIGGNVYVEIK